MLDDLRTIAFPLHDTRDSSLSVYHSLQEVPFNIKRVFVIHTRKFCDRGFHAHKECNQLLVCLQGRVIVTVDDGSQKKEFVLENASEGLLIPSSLWAEQIYEASSILMVLTDQPYDEKDYIRNYQEFLEYRKIKRGKE